jgi:superfamily II DNA or RNA helicase
MQPGSVVRCRNRDWVLLPSHQEEVFLLRPLAGSSEDAVAVHKRLADLVGYDLPEERVRPSKFPEPTVEDLSDATSAHLLWQSARLSLREGAAPLRSLGRISIRPREYQFVPLLMALRLDPVRLLIADDVGVGKTIEALLIARELWDRGEIKRICVLCPPYLCDQWQQEINEKVNLDAVVVRPATIGSLERNKPSNKTIYEHYPVQIVSIDWVKSERNKNLFLLHCPEFVIVDEAHGVAPADSRSQQERHELVKELASSPNRHLVLLTATPHSGVREAFQMLLGLLDEEFAAWDVANLDETKRSVLAKHFVQRTRADVVHGWETERCFPERELRDETYPLSADYKELFQRTYGFCTEMVKTGEALGERQRRVRYWAALALLRSVMSSPAAAIAALTTKLEKLSEIQDEVDFRGYVFESTEERTDDEQPATPIEEADATLQENERRRLRELAKLAERVRDEGQDTKAIRCAEIVRSLLKDGLHPIIWCRYVATAEYVADYLRQKTPNVQVVCVTGRQADDERRERINAIDPQMPRVLVATDCLSEGINLQEKFTAAIHYDLPWNPNRLEQREGRVDRFGQTAPKVVTIRYFSPDNPVDGVLLDVLLNKAREIRRVLGTHVPVPEESDSVTEAVLKALFLRGSRARQPDQLTLELAAPEVGALHKRWDEAAEREKLTRTRFAQRAMKADEVRRELETVDEVLGDPNAVRAFVLSAAQRLGLLVQPAPNRADVYAINVSAPALTSVPEAVRLALPEQKDSNWLISFLSPTPQGAEYIGRNHRFVAALANFLLEEALEEHSKARASRCGVIRTRAIDQLTTILLLRVRYLVNSPNPMLSEEVMVCGFAGGAPQGPAWLDDEEALRLLAEAKPDANLPIEEKRELIQSALSLWPSLQSQLNERIESRARNLAEAHKRIRKAASLRIQALAVQPQLPPDLLGILILQPMVELS